ncbi:hypothetical protein J4032_16245 [Streptomyces formicae]|uniref:Uncharacterized protein n=1 Tax=Streptomyces formicae TaxID=1616117 RepID=A0ABY3WJT1_9ACTN|nr:hypothetical protein J4032_16245 [Streptomyces formicae]
MSRTATMPLKTPAYAVPSGPMVIGAQLLSYSGPVPVSRRQRRSPVRKSTAVRYQASMPTPLGGFSYVGRAAARR